MPSSQLDPHPQPTPHLHLHPHQTSAKRGISNVERGMVPNSPFPVRPNPPSRLPSSSTYLASYPPADQLPPLQVHARDLCIHLCASALLHHVCTFHQSSTHLLSLPHLPWRRPAAPAPHFSLCLIPPCHCRRVGITWSLCRPPCRPSRSRARRARSITSRI